MCEIMPTRRRPGRPGAPGLLLGVLAVSGLGAVEVSAQYELPLLSVAFDPADYGLERAADVRRGQLSVAYAPNGIVLNPYYLRADPNRPRVEPPEPPVIPPAVDSAPASGRETALWVWSTREILDDVQERERFLDFIEDEGITRVFLHLAWAEDDRPVAGFTPFDGERLGPLVADLRARGALTYGLDGDRDFVRRENHEGVWRTVDRMVAHNARVPPEQRFHGIRYDIEPYLVPGFQGPHRETYLDGYVELLAGVAERARKGGLRVAVDIPLWFDAPDEESGAIMEATLDGERAPIVRHIFELVDDIAIMDYRTDAFGPNGAISHALGELALGDRMDVDVFVGVETVRLVDEDLHTFWGPAADGLPTHAEARWVVVEGRPDGSGRIWLVDGPAQLAELETRVGDAVSVRHWPAGRPTRVAADAQSFYNLGEAAMEKTTAEILRHLSGAPAFAGLAFHDYRGLVRLRSERR